MYVSNAFKISLFGLVGTSTALWTNSSGTYQRLAAASYNLVDTYNSNNFFNNFNFFTGSDPTHGFVSYQSQGAAASQGLINSNNGRVYMGVNHTTYNPPAPGRASVRVESKKAYNHGLFIADIAHMPGSICGVWPATGEIDIIEGVNNAGSNTMTLHTSPGCNINTAGSQYGTNLQHSNCNQDNGNAGCGAITSTANAYGDSFNNNGGGVYAMQWESSGIYIWFFQRGNIPVDISNERPMTGNWGMPVAAFNGGNGCNIDSYFRNQNIIFDTTFCGDWAGSVWGSSSCASRGSCRGYVGANPNDFAPAYWSSTQSRFTNFEKSI